MDGIARQNASPFFWYPFFYVIQDLLGNEVLGERGLQTRFRQTTLGKTFVYWGYSTQNKDVTNLPMCLLTPFVHAIVLA